MADTELTLVRMKVSGTAPTTTSPLTGVVGKRFYFANAANGKAFLLFKNTAPALAAAVVIEVSTAAQSGMDDEVAITIPAASTILVGPFVTTRFGTDVYFREGTNPAGALCTVAALTT
jgi:hypothetical protein